jgi:hypothetical protein
MRHSRESHAAMEEAADSRLSLGELNWSRFSLGDRRGAAFYISQIHTTKSRRGDASSYWLMDIEIIPSLLIISYYYII